MIGSANRRKANPEIPGKDQRKISLVYNFTPGPALLPPGVLREAAAQLVDFRESGTSIVEVSHRSSSYEEMHRETMVLCRRIYAVPDHFAILLLQGGASTQFGMVPLNLIRPGSSADYVHTGNWSAKAIEEVRILGKNYRIAASSADRNFSYIPSGPELNLDGSAEYLHITTNNTVYGTQYPSLPDTGGVCLVADMSSDILSRPLAWENIGLVYAGAQKNAGIAGLTLVILRRDLLQRECPATPTMLRYSTHVKSHSLYNTPPTFAVCLLNLVLHWIEAQGGLAGMERRNRRKAELIYHVLDGHGGFYRGHAELPWRSQMNIAFNLWDRGLEPVFLGDAENAGLRGLEGHRALGGVRASVYNAMSPEGCKALADFMTDFARRYG